VQCDQGFMNGYCRLSCGKCSNGTTMPQLPPPVGSNASCIDKAPDTKYTCEQQAAWGKVSVLISSQNKRRILLHPPSSPPLSFPLPASPSHLSRSLPLSPPPSPTSSFYSYTFQRIKGAYVFKRIDEIVPKSCSKSLCQPCCPPICLFTVGFVSCCQMAPHTALKQAE
jgi:hypothetical protein